jgi:alpha-tubulin suppressor-like RCC1 family protein
VYAWVDYHGGATLGNLTVDGQLLPTAVEVLRGVHVGSVAASCGTIYAVADTGEVWAWGFDRDGNPPLGHGQQKGFPRQEPMESLQGIKVDAVTGGRFHTLALAGGGRVYAWSGAQLRQYRVPRLGRSSKWCRKERVDAAARPTPGDLGFGWHA